jgi:hypothetical protein
LSLAQQLRRESRTIVAPRLAHFDDPLLALHVQRQLAVRIAEPQGSDLARDLKFLCGRPAPAMMRRSRLRQENSRDQRQLYFS